MSLYLGVYGRNLDSNSCPENTDLPNATFGDYQDILKTRKYSFSFKNSYPTNNNGNGPMIMENSGDATKKGNI